MKKNKNKHNINKIRSRLIDKNFNLNNQYKYLYLQLSDLLIISNSNNISFINRLFINDTLKIKSSQVNRSKMTVNDEFHNSTTNSDRMLNTMATTSTSEI